MSKDGDTPPEIPSLRRRSQVIVPPITVPDLAEHPEDGSETQRIDAASMPEARRPDRTQQPTPVELYTKSQKIQLEHSMQRLTAEVRGWTDKISERMAEVDARLKTVEGTLERIREGPQPASPVAWLGLATGALAFLLASAALLVLAVTRAP